MTRAVPIRAKATTVVRMRNGHTLRPLKGTWLLCMDIFSGVRRKVADFFVLVRSLVCAGRLLVTFCRYVLWCVQEGCWLLSVETFCGVCRKVAGCFVWVRSVVLQEGCWLLCVNTFCSVCGKVAGCFVWVRFVVCARKLLVTLCKYLLWCVQKGC